MAVLKTLLESQPEVSELVEHDGSQVELDPETRRILARCYLRFARRGRAILAGQAAQQASLTTDVPMIGDMAGQTDNMPASAAKDTEKSGGK